MFLSELLLRNVNYIGLSKRILMKRKTQWEEESEMDAILMALTEARSYSHSWQLTQHKHWS